MHLPAVSPSPRHSASYSSHSPSSASFPLFPSLPSPFSFSFPTHSSSTVTSSSRSVGLPLSVGFRFFGAKAGSLSRVSLPVEARFIVGIGANGVGCRFARSSSSPCARRLEKSLQRSCTARKEGAPRLTYSNEKHTYQVCSTGLGKFVNASREKRRQRGQGCHDTSLSGCSSSSASSSSNFSSPDSSLPSASPPSYQSPECSLYTSSNSSIPCTCGTCGGSEQRSQGGNSVATLNPPAPPASSTHLNTSSSLATSPSHHQKDQGTVDFQLCSQPTKSLSSTPSNPSPPAAFPASFTSAPPYSSSTPSDVTMPKRSTRSMAGQVASERLSLLLSSPIVEDSLQISDGGRIVESREARLASLWAGYGSVDSLQLTVETADGRREKKHLVVKTVDPPADGEGCGHQRKLKSYGVEACFYRNIAPKLLSEGVAIPQPLAIQQEGTMFQFLMTDLRPDFPLRAGRINETMAKTCLTFLAKLHAAYWETKLPSELWEEGTYWHLATRQEELHAMNGREWGRLKIASGAIDRRLRGIAPKGVKCTPGRHRTLVHGDFKAANILSTKSGDAVAVVDWQYTGGGYGVKDVAYFLCCSVDERVLAKDKQLLEHYHRELASCLDDKASYSLETMMDHYDLAVADFTRFLIGWGMWGSASYAVRRTQDVLMRLDGGRTLEEHEYDQLIWREYPERR